MPRKSDSLPINNPKLDKRVKLTDEQRKDIIEEYATGNASYRSLGKKYGVDKDTVAFIIKPDRRKKAQEQFKERQKDGRYYNKEKHREYIKKHRDHKKDLYEKGLLKENIQEK